MGRESTSDGVAEAASGSEFENVELESPRVKVPAFARIVRASGTVATVSLAEEYDPSPDSGRREAFADKIDRLADAERDEIVCSADVLL